MDSRRADFLMAANRSDPERRQALLVDFFKSVQLNGLNYLVNAGNGEIVAIRRPDCSLHEIATEYLQAHSHKALNTRARLAGDLKKVVDFALICGSEVGDGQIPLKLFLRGLAEYVKVLAPDLEITHRSDWCKLARIPLHPLFHQKTALLPGARERDGVVPLGMSRLTVHSVVRTAVHFFGWLSRQYPDRYGHLLKELQELPTKTVRNTKSVRAGSAQPSARTVIDIAEIAGIFNPSLHNRSLLPHELLTVEEVVELYRAAATRRTSRDILILAMLEGWGLRRGALANLTLVSESIPRLGTGRLSSHQEMQLLKDSLRGDLVWVNFPNGGRWTITVQDHGNLRRDTQLKRARAFLLTYEYDNDPFTGRLYSWLLERQGILDHAKKPDHGRLFVSLGDNSLGEPLNGRGITKLFARLVDDAMRLTGKDLRKDPLGRQRRVSPHSIRHYYATTELAVNKRTDVEVARRLLHAPGNVETVQETYYHLIPNNLVANTSESVLQLWQTLNEQRRGELHD